MHLYIILCKPTFTFYLGFYMGSCTANRIVTWIKLNVINNLLQIRSGGKYLYWNLSFWFHMWSIHWQQILFIKRCRSSLLVWHTSLLFKKIIKWVILLHIDNNNLTRKEMERLLKSIFFPSVTRYCGVWCMTVLHRIYIVIVSYELLLEFIKERFWPSFLENEV